MYLAPLPAAKPSTLGVGRLDSRGFHGGEAAAESPSNGLNSSPFAGEAPGAGRSALAHQCALSALLRRHDAVLHQESHQESDAVVH